MKRTRRILALGAALLVAAGPAAAFDLRPDGASVEAGIGEPGTYMAGVGLVWDWDFERMRREAALTAHTEVLINRWRYNAVGGGEDELTHFVVLPSLRMRLDRGRSPWFVELGIGVSWMDHHFATSRKSFGTRWNFHDVLGVGHAANGGRHEVALRWAHVSNGGARDPNPGQDFLQLRYVRRF